MKKFKKIDAYISLSLIVFFIISISLNFQPGDGLVQDHILLSYFVIGGWQVISMLVHAITGTFVYGGGIRYIYHWITFIAVVTMPAGSVWILIFTAPFMAVFYTWLCFQEVYVKMRRPLSYLK